MASASQDNGKILNNCLCCCWLKGCLEKTVNAVKSAAAEGKKLGEEDPRRIVHSLKVGLSITLVSLIYYFDFLFNGFGVSAVWAVMTVVFVSEFSVGATLGRGVNRGIATLLGGALGVAAHGLGHLAGGTMEGVILGVFGFLIDSLVNCFLLLGFLTAAIATFARFFPKSKGRFDYGLVIFILTFSMISVSGYRDDQVLEMAQKRLATILIGVTTTILVSVIICPVWAGEDLHKLTAANIDKLGIFLDGFGGEYFLIPGNEKGKTETSMETYKTVLNSKSIEDTLVGFARWEPKRRPWDQYLIIGSYTRECAYKIDALNGYLHSDVQKQVEIRALIQESCTNMSSECSQAFRELATGIKTMTFSVSADAHIVNAKTACKNLKSVLKTGLQQPPEGDEFDVITVITVASLLIEIVSCAVNIADSVHELASLSKFKKLEDERTKQLSPETTATTPTRDGFHVVSIEL